MLRLKRRSFALLFTDDWLMDDFFNASLLSRRFAHPLYCGTVFSISMSLFAAYVGHVALPEKKKSAQYDRGQQSSSLTYAITYLVFGILYSVMPRFPDVSPPLTSSVPFSCSSSPSYGLVAAGHTMPRKFFWLVAQIDAEHTNLSIVNHAASS